MVTRWFWEPEMQSESDIFYHLRVLYNFGFVVCPICVRELPFANLITPLSNLIFPNLTTSFPIKTTFRAFSVVVTHLAVNQV